MAAVINIRTIPINANTSSHPIIPFKFADVKNLDHGVPAPVHNITYADTGTNIIAGITTENTISIIQAFIPERGSFTGTGFAADAKKGFCINKLIIDAKKNIIAIHAIPEKICCESQNVSFIESGIGSSFTAASKERIASIVFPLILPV